MPRFGAVGYVCLNDSEASSQVNGSKAVIFRIWTTIEPCHPPVSGRAGRKIGELEWRDPFGQVRYKSRLFPSV